MKGPYVDAINNFLEHAATIGTIAITATIQSEAEPALTRAVNRMAERAHIHAPAYRKSLVQKVKQKLLQLQGRLTLIQSCALPFARIKAFYEQLLSHYPAHFRAIQRVKHRSSIYPEDTDMTILAEAAGLAQTGQRTFLLSDDHDFTTFPQPIWTTFQVCIIPLRWIPINPPEIATLLQSPCHIWPLPEDLQLTPEN